MVISVDKTNHKIVFEIVENGENICSASTSKEKAKDFVDFVNTAIKMLNEDERRLENESNSQSFH